MGQSERIEGRTGRERRFYDEEYLVDSRRTVDEYHSVSENAHRLYQEYLCVNGRHKRVLEYGCGLGSGAFTAAERGAEVVGIDASIVAIQLAAKRAAEAGLSDKLAFTVMDCEVLSFKDSSFDVIGGRGILHHLNLRQALREVTRVLKPEGKAMFLDPLGHNVAINLYRKLTPQYRTPDERPLRKQDLELIGRFFNRVEYRFYHLTSLLAIPLRATRWFSPALQSLESLDGKLFEWIPSLRAQAWKVAITCEGPRKDVVG